MKNPYRLLIAGILASFVVSAASAQADAHRPVATGAPEIISHRINGQAANAAPTAGGTTKTTAILYRGGPVMGGTVNVYVIWYGDWNQANGTDTPAGQQIVRDFLTYIGGSPYMTLNNTYSTASTLLTGAVNFAGETTNAGSLGTSVADAGFGTIVTNAIPYLNGGIADPNGIYLVLTSSNVTASSGFCTKYCGWHTYGTIAGKNIKYSFVGNAARCLSGCAAQSVSPNGNAGVDGMLSVVAHELVETISDPNLNAWYDSRGAENADKCAWTFGSKQYQVANGSYANMKLGTRDFLIQRNLAHTGSGDFCGTAYNPVTKVVTK